MEAQIAIKRNQYFKGFTQTEGVDYDKTFSPVARLSAIRALLGVAANEGLTLHQCDVSTAFLNGKVVEEIHKRQPEGSNDGTKTVCKLNRSLYGLKQAPRCWNTYIDDFLIKSDFKRSEDD